MHRVVGHSKSSKASSSCSNAIVEPQVSGLLQDCRLSITAKKKMQQNKKAAEKKMQKCSLRSTTGLSTEYYSKKKKAACNRQGETGGTTEEMRVELARGRWQGGLMLLRSRRWL